MPTSFNTMEPIIEARSIGKSYRITHQKGGYVALRDVISTILRRPFSFLRHKARGIAGGSTEAFWALKDVSFSIQKGEVVGIIGPNGAGKSTLLKILSQITPPTTGSITLRGRVASLLEVGTGFHPELSGRENIFLNGAILGMTRREIEKKFDAIVEFAGVQQFLDTPVKYYSSGMYVRLAFSVAAHIEPDILIVDEVLAVGDAEFQKKCLGKMEEVTQQDGRTILFVSHNMAAIQNICKTCILLENGQIKKIGPTHEVIDYYLNKSDHGTAVTEIAVRPGKEDRGAHVTKVSVLRDDETPSVQLPISKPFTIEIEYTVTMPIANTTVSIAVYRDGDLLLLSSDSDTTGTLSSREPGSYVTHITVPSFLFNVGGHFFDVLIHQPMAVGFDHVQNLYFEVTDVDNPRSAAMAGENPGKLAAILEHHTKRLDA